MSISSIPHWVRIGLVLGGLTSVGGPASAYYYSRGGYVRTGSVRYGSVPPQTARSSTSTGSVRYGSTSSGGTLAATYDRDYMARLPQGYHTMPGAGGKTYAYYRSLPRGAQPANLGGTSKYYVNNNVYYKATSFRGTRVYMAVPPPR